MLRILRNILGRDHTPPSSQTWEADGPLGVAAALDGEAGRADYEAFCAGFCFRPRKNLMRFLAANDLQYVCDWLHWSTPEPEPKAFVQLGVELMRRSVNLWDQSGVTMYMKGRRPTQVSQDCLSILAQVTGKPIKLLIEITPGEPLEVLEFSS